VKHFSAFFRILIAAASAAGFLWLLAPAAYGVMNIGSRAGMAVCAVLFFGAVFFDRIRDAAKRSRAFRTAFLTAAVILCAGALWTAAMTCCMLSCSCAAETPEGTTVIVLGSEVRGDTPSLDLQIRINTAQAYLEAHPDAKCIASGGKGSNENLSEAEAIRNTLAEAGIDPARILPEDASRTTQENLENSLRTARENGLPARFAIVTDDYHEFRACSTARALGAEAYPVPAATPGIILSACWAREVLALAKYFLFPG
jgi:uncharacterized SAM-binding protein YcdF (DUF218 family)